MNGFSSVVQKRLINTGYSGFGAPLDGGRMAISYRVEEIPTTAQPDVRIEVAGYARNEIAYRVWRCNVKHAATVAAVLVFLPYALAQAPDVGNSTAAIPTAQVILAAPASEQQPDTASKGAQAGQPGSTPSGPSAPRTITLSDALALARANNPQLRSTITDVGVAREDRVQTRAALLPAVNYSTQYLYTEGNGTPTGVYIANNAVHEYLSQGNAHEVLNLGPGQIAAYRRSAAALALARAKQEIASRGLVVTVVQAYYGLVVAQRKYADSQQAFSEAQRFLTITQQLENGGEVAHSDVIKAQLQFNDRQRDLRETNLNIDKTRLALAVLLFPNFEENFTVVDDLRLAPVLPTFDEAAKMGKQNNPDLRAAMSALEVADRDVQIAWSAHLPTLTLDAWYGIDATHFATYTGQIQNLGYSASAMLTIPVWSWGATQSKVRQAQLKREQARVELTFAQRQLIANLRTFYADADAARSEGETLRSSTDLAAESVRLTTLRYRAGEATVLEVVDAQNTLVLTRAAFDDAQVRYRVSLANLQTVTGSF